MPNTPIFALPYPDPTDAPDGPTQLQGLAEAVETELDTIYGGVDFGGNVSTGGNLSSAGTLTVAGTSTLNNDVGVTGDVAVTGGLSTTGDISATGDIYAGSIPVARMVKGKLHTGSLVDTATTDTVNWTNIIGANILNVPVVVDHIYKAEFQVSVTSSVANDRIRYALWNGTVGGTQCGSIMPIVRIETTTTYRVQTFGFIWRAPTTETISNLNLGMIRFSGSGTVETRIEITSFYGLVWDLGLNAPVTNA